MANADVNIFFRRAASDRVLGDKVISVVSLHVQINLVLKVKL